MVGDFVGEREGDLDGLLLVGEVLGLLVVGDLDGLLVVGDLDGERDGDLDGLRDGEALGAWVVSSTQTHMNGSVLLHGSVLEPPASIQNDAAALFCEYHEFCPALVLVKSTQLLPALYTPPE